MNWSFVKYFFSYLLHAKTRQRLLFIAVLGLIISSFALLVLQSTMGGLQEKLISRSKKVSGHGVISFPNTHQNKIKEFVKKLNREVEFASSELELELLVKYGQFYAPIIIHGVELDSKTPHFLRENDFRELVLPRALAYQINAGVGDLVRLMSPAHLDSFIGGVPRMSSLEVDYLVSTDVPEIDDFHGWAKLIRIQAILGERVVNKIRLFGQFDEDTILSLIKEHGPKGSELHSWEKLNSTLVWALGLETTVMVFLFAAMTLLVSLAITSGLLVFFNKIRVDLASFWVLGISEASVFKSTKAFLVMLTFFSVVAGLLLGLALLYFLDQYGFNIMPAVFVDRKIPVKITAFGLGVSFAIPFVISLVFAWLSLKAFKKDVNYLSFIRTLGA